MKFNLFRKNKNRIIGTGNQISLPEEPRIKYRVYGNNNTVIIENTPYKLAVEIHIGAPDCPVDNCRLIIGADCSANGTLFLLKENNTSITVGKDCMFGSGVSVWNTDGHSIYDQDGSIINCASDIKIGNHVWVCSNVKIGKNVTIRDNSVIGYGSVVTRRFEQKNVIIAGSPARIVKTQIRWGRESPTPDNHL